MALPCVTKILNSSFWVQPRKRQSPSQGQLLTVTTCRLARPFLHFTDCDRQAQRIGKIMNDRRKLSTEINVCCMVILTTDNPLLPHLGMNPGFCDSKQASKHLSYGTACDLWHNTCHSYSRHLTSCELWRDVYLPNYGTTFAMAYHKIIHINAKEKYCIN